MKATILLAAYNEEKYLQEAIESVLAQQHQDWELILVDDGSADQTATIMESYQSVDPRIRIASSRKRLGKVGAFNAAATAITGEFVVMLGGDDVMAPDGLRARLNAYSRVGRPKVVTFHKIQTMSSNPRFDGQIIPRGKSGNTSGPGMGFSRAVADLIFPIPAELPSEDIWLSEAAEAVAEDVVHGREVVTYYRVHADNSNPRHKTFKKMSESIHKRMEARRLILDSSSIRVPAPQRRRLETSLELEEDRYQGRVLGILLNRNARFVDKLANISMAHPLAWKVRSKFFKAASGWRGR